MRVMLFCEVWERRSMLSDPRVKKRADDLKKEKEVLIEAIATMF